MAKKNYEALADEIIEVMGGKENMTFFIHCLTRLRFNVKDKGLIDNEKLKNIKGVVGSQWQGDQFQIIIGQHVGDVYKVICQKAGFEVKEIIKEDADVPKKKLSISLIFDGYDICHNTEYVIEKRGYNKDADIDYTSSSIFCSKGQAYSVDAEKVEEYMHCL